MQRGVSQVWQATWSTLGFGPMRISAATLCVARIFPFHFIAPYPAPLCPNGQMMQSSVSMTTCSSNQTRHTARWPHPSIEHVTRRQRNK